MGDSVQVMATMPGSSVDMVFADPPYNFDNFNELIEQAILHLNDNYLNVSWGNRQPWSRLNTTLQQMRHKKPKLNRGRIIITTPVGEPPASATEPPISSSKVSTPGLTNAIFFSLT